MATATSLVPVEAGLTGDYLPPVDPKAVEQAMLIGDISKMTNEQRIAYYVATCRSLGLNPLTKPFQAIQGDDGKLSLYPDKGCAEQLRKLHRVSVKVMSREFLDDLYIVTVRASTPDGREEEAQGVVPMAKPKGTWKETQHGKRYFQAEIGADGKERMIALTVAERATAVMRAETKAKRRVTLAICGLGLPDYEAEPTSPAHPMALALQSDVPGEADKSVEDHIADLCGDVRPEPTGAPIKSVTRPAPETVSVTTQRPQSELFNAAESARLDAEDAEREAARDEAANPGVQGS